MCLTAPARVLAVDDAGAVLWAVTASAPRPCPCPTQLPATGRSWPPASWSAT